MFDDDFDDIFTTKCELFLIDDEPEYDVFKFDNQCSTTDCLISSTSESNSLPISLELSL